MNQTHALDDVLEEMLPAAAAVTVAVRDRDPAAVSNVIGPLVAAIPQQAHRDRIAALIVDLAVMVPVDVPFGDLLAWTHGEHVPPEKYAELVAFDPRPGMKWCRGCKDWWQLEEFNRDRTQADGRKPRCRMCMSKGRLAKKAAA
ncbi:MAG: hypothetical protein JWO67_1047 [Streptosporangiaceae bacterium]|nr:hypothetical protein [Streptosporangiaceae bacterium]